MEEEEKKEDSSQEEHTPPEEGQRNQSQGGDPGENATEHLHSGDESTGGELQEERSAEDIPPHFQKLYKSRANRIILGVCGGLGKYFNIDPVIFRLAFIISLLLGGWGILVYLAAGIIMPADPGEIPAPKEQSEESRNENTKIVIGSALIMLGLFALLRSTGLIRYFSFFGLTNEIVIPVILIAIGIFLIYRHNGRPGEVPEEGHRTRLHLSSVNKKIAGVCGGLGEYLGIDPSIIRILWIIFTFSSFGVGILIYFLFAVSVPKEEDGVNIEQE